MICRLLILVSVFILGTTVVVSADEKEAVPDVTLTEKDTGKTIMAEVGKVIEIRLPNEKDGAGWEPGGSEITGKSVVRASPRRRGNCDEFVADKNANTNITVGTYVYRYVCATAGKSSIRLTHLYPSGPIPRARTATLFIGEFLLTVEVRDKPSALRDKTVETKEDVGGR
jgi:hypothetical protein